MMRSLLDLSFLIALLDPQHSFHDFAHNFWSNEESRVWSTCPLIENGVIRVLTGTKYPGRSSYSNTSVIESLSSLIETSDHEFWADDISLLDSSLFDQRSILGPKQLTDIYLLGLAVSKGGRLVTFDQKIPLSAVRGATKKNLLVVN